MLDGLAEAIARDLDFRCPVVAGLLVDRGITSLEEARLFVGGGVLHHHSLLPGVPEAARLILSGPPPVIYGDYDVDGVTGTASLSLALSRLGVPHSTFLPDRRRHGYGLNPEAVREIASLGPRTLVTVDCGIACPDEVLLARSLGCPVVVTDHHQPRHDGVLPEADVIVHPLVRPGYPSPGLCGSAVAYKLATAILDAGGVPDSEPIRQDILALASLGTVADVVPLTSENRDIVRAGLAAFKKSTRPGIAALCAECNFSGKAEDFGFQIGPRINACGRLESASKALEILLCGDVYEAMSLAAHATALNERRRSIEKRITEAALDSFSPSESAVVAFSEEWHHGVVGVSAGRIAEQTGLPSFVGTLHDGYVSGSARAGNHPSVRDLLAGCADLLDRWGGHHAAAGFRVRADLWPAFRERLMSLAGSGKASPRPKGGYEIRLEDVTLDLAADLDRLEPFGAGNPAPVFLARGVLKSRAPRLMGKTGDHLNVEFARQGTPVRAVGFRMGGRINEVAFGGPLDILFKVRVNEWMGRKSAEIDIQDFKCRTRPAT